MQVNVLILTLSKKSLGNTITTLVHLAEQEDNVPQPFSRITEL